MRPTPRSLSLAPLFAAAVLATTAAAQEPQFTVEVLGTGFPQAMNDAGQVVGWMSSGGAVRGWYADTSGQSLLPLPPGNVGSKAFDIDGAGRIVGLVSTTGLAETGEPALWTPNGAGWDVVTLATLDGFSFGAATAINDVGDIVGYSQLAGFMGGPATLFTEPGGPLNLTLAGFSATPADVNDQRQIVGNQLRMDLDTMVVENLGLPAGPQNYTFTRAAAIAESGQVAGVAHLATAGNSPYQVARYTDGPGWEILSPAGAINNAQGINSDGTVMLEYGAGAAMIVALWIDGAGLRPLDTLMAPGFEDWFFVSAFAGDVNEAGQVVALGQNNVSGEGGVVLLTPACTEAVTYCTAKVNSQGCVLAIAASGLPSASDPAPFDLTAAMVLNQKSGLFFYGLAGRAVVPFQGGTLCAQPPLARTAVQSSGGNPPPDDCSGAYSFDFNALIQSGTMPQLAPGAQVNGQYWSRDPSHPDGTGAGLTDAVEFTICG